MERDEDRAVWCAECVQEYGFSTETVERVLTGLNGSPEAAQMLLEACADCGLDPIPTMQEALRTEGPFRISRPVERPASPLTPPPRAVNPSSEGEGSWKKTRPVTVPQDELDIGRPARTTGMAAEICLALIRQRRVRGHRPA